MFTYKDEYMAKARGGPGFVEIAGVVLNTSEILRVERSTTMRAGMPEHVTVYFVNGGDVLTLPSTLEEALKKLRGV